MKIAIVSKLWEETSSESRGGTGASVGNLVNGLVDRGHQVTLFATGDSKTKAQKLISILKKPYQNNYSEVKEFQNISQAFKMADQFDIINCHVEHKSVFFANLVKTPSVHTIRYGEFFKDELGLLRQYKHLNFIANSQALKKLLPFIKFKGIVYNGLDLKNFPFSGHHQGYLLFLGRLSPQKGPDIAIRTAQKTNQRLILAGKMMEIDEKFLNKEVLPYLDGKKIIYRGLVGFKDKIKLLRGARALIQPVRIFEACSNTILEAMALGTPVIAFDQGSNRELVEDGKTGFIAKTPQQLLAAIKKIDLIERSYCRKRVEKNFTIQKMVDGYEKIYRTIVKKRK